MTRLGVLCWMERDLAVCAGLGVGHDLCHCLEEGDVGKGFGGFCLENLFACFLEDFHCRVEHAVVVLLSIAPNAHVEFVSVILHTGEEYRVQEFLFVLLVNAKHGEENFNRGGMFLRSLRGDPLARHLGGVSRSIAWETLSEDP